MFYKKPNPIYYYPKCCILRVFITISVQSGMVILFISVALSKVTSIYRWIFAQSSAHFNALNMYTRAPKALENIHDFYYELHL